MLYLIFIGDRFYSESGTIMSSIYTEDGHRSDWGHVKDVLARGETVTIRPADSRELAHYEARLNEILARRFRDGQKE